jgi:hypothetical protein
MEYILYGKRNGVLNDNGQPIFDKVFRPLNSNGVRVIKKKDAMSYATKEDILEILNRPNILKKIQQGLLKFDIRKG